MEQNRVTHIKLWYTEWHIKVEFCTCRPITAISPCSRGQRVWGGERGTTLQTTAPNPQETNRYDNSSTALHNYKIRFNLIWTVVAMWGFPSSCFVTNNIMTRSSFRLLILSFTMKLWSVLGSCLFVPSLRKKLWPGADSYLLFLLLRKRLCLYEVFCLLVLHARGQWPCPGSYPLVPVCNTSFSVVLEPDLGLDHLSRASLLIPLKLVLSGSKSFVSFHSVKMLTQLIVGSTDDAKDRVLVLCNLSIF
jgi:hypothetical protein